MSPIQPRTKRLESFISIALSAILILIAIIILLKQSDTDISRFGIETAKTVKKAKSALLPLTPDAFEILSDFETYIAENLYEKINGKAPLYIESGFQQLLSRRFVNKNNKSLWIELFAYDMANIKNAFSVYSLQKRPDAKTLAQPHTYRTTNGLYFVHGKYYIELIGSAESDELFKAISELAQKIRKNLSIQDNTITQLSLFPPQNIIPGSTKLYLANTFGFEKLTNTFTARYEIDGEIVTAFFSKRIDTDNAEKIAKQYQNFLIENGAITKNALNKILQDKVFGFYGATEIVLSTGYFVVGVHEAESQKAAEKLAIMVINSLKQNND